MYFSLIFIILYMAADFRRIPRFGRQFAIFLPIRHFSAFPPFRRLFYFLLSLKYRYINTGTSSPDEVKGLKILNFIY